MVFIVRFCCQSCRGPPPLLPTGPKTVKRISMQHMIARFRLRHTGRSQAWDLPGAPYARLPSRFTRRVFLLKPADFGGGRSRHGSCHYPEVVVGDGCTLCSILETGRNEADHVVFLSYRGRRAGGVRSMFWLKRACIYICIYERNGQVAITPSDPNTRYGYPRDVPE